VLIFSPGFKGNWDIIIFGIFLKIKAAKHIPTCAATWQHRRAVYISLISKIVLILITHVTASHKILTVMNTVSAYVNARNSFMAVFNTHSIIN